MDFFPSPVFSFFILKYTKNKARFLVEMAGGGSSNDGWEGRYLNKNCKCGKRAGIRISETDENKNKLFYFCKDNKYGSFLGWCIPVSSFATSHSNGSVDSRLRYKDRIKAEDLDELKEEVEELKAENKIMMGKMEGVELTLSFIRSLVVMVLFFCICLFIFMMGVVLKNL